MTQRDDHADLPPIPDGGLAASMPEWLRRPPAWRTLEDSEVVPPAPVESAALPAADTSPIDPRTFLGDDDLPAWLRDLGHARPAVPVASDEEGEASDAVAPSMEPPPPAAPRPAPAARFAPVRPVVHDARVGRPALPAREAAPRDAPERRPAAWWQGPMVVLLLGVLLLVAMVVIAVLAVA